MPRLKVLLVGSGAEEQSIYNNLHKSNFIEKIYIAGKTKMESNSILYSDYDELAQKALSLGIELVLVASEKDICSGIVDILASYGLECIGTNRKYSRLASSKLFAKKFMDKYNILHPKTLSQDSEEYPLVIKHDEKYKLPPQIIYTNEEKKRISKEYKNNYFFEEYIAGEELSVTSFYNGECLTNFEPIKINTNQFKYTGSSCPYFLSYEKYDKLQNYLTLLEHALLEDDANFKGFITSNLIWKNNEWFVLSFGATSGEKQTQTLLTHLESDLLSTLLYRTRQKYKEKTTATIVVNYKVEQQDLINSQKNENIITCLSDITSRQNKMLTLSTTADFPFKVLEKFADEMNIKFEYQKKNKAS